MPRKKLTITESVVDAIFEKEVKPYVIKEASLKDGSCPYVYEVTDGINKGDTHKVNAQGYVHDDMNRAFTTLNVHMAFIDDVFKHSNIEIDDIDKMHGHDLTFLYTVTGFQIKGSDENEGVVLIGTKYLSVGGRSDVKTPKIALDKTSSYKWFNELNDAINIAKREVELYKEGKFEPRVEEEEIKPNPKQRKLFDADVEAIAITNDYNDNIDEDFAEAAR